MVKASDTVTSEHDNLLCAHFKSYPEIIGPNDNNAFVYRQLKKIIASKATSTGQRDRKQHNY